MVDTQPAAGYALDSAWHAERARLDSLTRLYDPGTLELCQTIGVSDGWRCLDAGAGTGTLAEALATLVLPTGSVTALDIDTRFIDPLATFGRTLPRRLDAAGLTDIGTRAQAIQVRADPDEGLPQWELLADQLAPALLAGDLVTEDDLAAFHDLWHDGRSICFSPLMISCWGRRP